MGSGGCGDADGRSLKKAHLKVERESKRGDADGRGLEKAYRKAGRDEFCCSCAGTDSAGEAC